MIRLLVLAILLAAGPALAADLTGGNTVNCGTTRTWTEAAGANSSAFNVQACGAVVTNTGSANEITVYEANTAGTAGGILAVLPPTGSSDCSVATTCGSVWLYRGKYVLDCGGASCTADVKGQ